MRPLDPLSQCTDQLAAPSEVEALLRAAPPEQVREELGRLEQLGLVGPQAAALQFAHGALALREGRLHQAIDALEAATGLFEQGDEHDAEAVALAACEALLGRIRRGPRKIYTEIIESLERISQDHADCARVCVVADHYRGTAMRYAGHAEQTLQVLLDAFARSEGLLAERAQVLNSLGTLYVVLGAYGAAQAVLEHAVELNHQIGDRVSEAISYGQLGSAALARGELEAARRFLQRQEWFASRVGDSFGQARALVMLGDLAIDLERPDDAISFAEQARDIASAVDPPLGMWIAYATRTIGRAKIELGDDDAEAELTAARERFVAIGNQLGEALVRWDEARFAQRRGDAGALELRALGSAAWSFAGLGLTARVAQVLSDLRDHCADDPPLAQAIDRALAAAAQGYPHMSAAQEVELVYSQPDTLSDIATRRIEGQRNLGRLAALTLAEPGLFVAAIAGNSIATADEGAEAKRAMPSRRAQAALLGCMPSVALWGWPRTTSVAEVARDLSSLRAACGDDVRAALCFCPEARVVAAPLAGHLSAELSGVELGSVVQSALAAAPGELHRSGQLDWDGEAEALVRMSGLRSVEPAD